MNPNFWQDKWQSKQIGFNQSEPNSLLKSHFTKLNAPAGSTVCVPLCGKSIDMVWLAEQGYDVVGVELVEQAVVEFFAENQITPTIHSHSTNPKLKFYKGSYGDNHKSQTIIIWVGDIFELTAEDIGQIAAIYDRAALVALPDDGDDALGNHSLRVRYTQHLMALTRYADQLLLTFGLDDEFEDKYDKISGPPFFITKAKIHSYYADSYIIDIVEEQQAPSLSTKGRPFLNIAWVLKHL
ncbi:thiopurine S-methyltransferase [Psychrobacter sp.]|uniref:thiopurine S-methyltransferase n=1 Tax=Psychrobacter sp. TaxID=56811 RepID=UPI0025D3077F|nr:thiopurine S-methyltransferase [Psychrobacter sp.]